MPGLVSTKPQLPETFGALPFASQIPAGPQPYSTIRAPAAPTNATGTISAQAHVQTLDKVPDESVINIKTVVVACAISVTVTIIVAIVLYYGAIDGANKLPATLAGQQNHVLTGGGSWAKLGLGLTGEMWRDVIKERTPGTLYPTTPLTYPMYVSVTVHSLNGSQVASLSIDGIIMGYIENHTGATIYSTLSGIVPPGKQYSVGVIKATVYKWYELY
jgi:hypothetical protein